MSYCVSHGKDKVIFLTDEDLKKPSSVTLPEDEEPRGFFLPNGDINWACPCMGNMVVGPCSVEFRESLSCFHKSTTEPKGSDCLEHFKEMNECLSKYPNLYKKSDEDSEKNLRTLDSEQNESISSLKSIDESNSTVETDPNNLSKQ